MKINTKQIVFTGNMLALCIASQFFKNVSVYITGPIVNTALILTAVYCGPVCGIFLSVISPITAFFITGSPIMSAIPLIIPCIILGNAMLVICVSIMKKIMSKRVSYIAGIIVGAGLKALVMTVLISDFLLTNYLPEKMQPMLKVFQLQFSVTQLITAFIGGVYAFIIILLIGNKYFVDDEKKL